MTKCYFIRSSATLLAAFLVGIGGCRPPDNSMTKVIEQPSMTPRTVPEFLEVGAECGFSFTYRNGEDSQHNTILESLGGGVGLLDYDRDGQLDLVVPGGGSFGAGPTIEGRSSAVFRQMMPGQFQEQSQLAGLAFIKQYTHGVAIGDFDNDGFADLLVTGYGALTAWHNRGDGTFQDVTLATKLVDTDWSTSAGWGDLNGDGSLDVYTHYVNWSFLNHPRCGTAEHPDVCPPRRFAGIDDLLLISDGAGSFVDGTATARITPGGKGLGTVLVDLDGDTDLDIYVANDTEENRLYLNDGLGHFEETGIISGTAVDDRGQPNGSMGVAVLDHNADGRVDLWVANFEDESFALYQNDGDGVFSHASSKTGIDAIGRLQVGFGTVSGDFDGDGDEDLVVSNGHVVHHPKNVPTRQLPLFLLNEGLNRFERIEFPSDSYLSTPHMGRGLAHGDLDRDGDLDLVFVNSNEPAVILMNQSEAHGRWLVVELVGTVSPRDGTGARVVMCTSKGERVRHAFGGGSYLSASARPIHFGYARDMVPQRLEVHWPSKTITDVELSPEQIQRQRLLVVE